MVNFTPATTHSPWRFCVAPMMDWSDRHCRYFWRLLSKEARLYTEMLSTGAILHGDRQRLLTYNQEEQPLALQVGGSDPKDLAESCRIAQDWGYQEVNLNCGCPSDRVQNNKIGACLMAEPSLVADCVDAMRQACAIPVTVKHRLGIDDLDSWSHLHHFVETVSDAGCEVFIVHARKAWLKGLSPKQNREVPPLDYDRVFELKRHFPTHTIVINGGISNLTDSASHLKHVDGVMLGREAYHNPYLLAEVDQTLFNRNTTPLSRIETAQQLRAYCSQQLTQGIRLSHVTRHILGLFNGVPGARLFRRHLSENAPRAGAPIAVLDEALAFITDHAHRTEQALAQASLESDPASSDNAPSKHDRGTYDQQT